jgi:hypothetical protein
MNCAQEEVPKELRHKSFSIGVVQERSTLSYLPLKLFHFISEPHRKPHNPV